ncbi:MAG: hypothetical protein U1E05_27895, partial [Patescibacteria group bacterium]|nr:hypothetical protein [Patescibacteria group bacterium]
FRVSGPRNGCAGTLGAQITRVRSWLSRPNVVQPEPPASVRGIARDVREMVCFKNRLLSTMVVA